MIARRDAGSVEKRFGDRPPAEPVQWINDNGSAHTANSLLARRVALHPLTTPVRRTQINGVAESFVKSIKRDYVANMPTPDLESGPA